MNPTQQNHSNPMWYKNIRAQNFLILALSLVGIVGSVYVFNLKSNISFEEQRQIETAVFTGLVDYLTYHPQADFDYFFLGISGSDPSPGILDDFENHRPMIEPISSSRISFGFSAPVVHKSELTKRGIQIDLETLDREPNGHVNVRASLYQDRASSATYIYTLTEYDDKFRVISVKRPDRNIF